MSEKPRRQWVYWLGGILAVLLAVCGGATYLLWGLVQGITGLFVTPANPTNEPDVVHTFPGQLPADLAFSPDGKLLAVVSPKWREIDEAATPPSDPPTLTVYDVTTGAKAFSATLARWPRAVAFSPDGKHLAVGLGGLVAKGEGEPKTGLVVYAVPGFAETAKNSPGPEFHTDRLEFAPDGSLLFTFREDLSGIPHEMTAWRFPDLTAGPKFDVRMPHPSRATVAGGVVLIGGLDKDGLAAVERFDPTGKPLGAVPLTPASSGPVVALRPNPPAKTAVAFTHTGRYEFDPATGALVGTPTASPNPLDSVEVVSADGSRGATSYRVASPGMAPDFRPWYQTGGFVRVVNRAGGATREWRVGIHPTPITFSPDGKHVAAGFDGTAGGGPTGVKVWVSP
ncbi:MAG: hypothetical protein ABGY75_05560 [Gemmataceae bacterium]